MTNLTKFVINLARREVTTDQNKTYHFRSNQLFTLKSSE